MFTGGPGPGHGKENVMPQSTLPCSHSSRFCSSGYAAHSPFSSLTFARDRPFALPHAPPRPVGPSPCQPAHSRNHRSNRNRDLTASKPDPDAGLRLRLTISKSQNLSRASSLSTPSASDSFRFLQVHPPSTASAKCKFFEDSGGLSSSKTRSPYQQNKDRIRNKIENESVSR